MHRLFLIGLAFLLMAPGHGHAARRRRPVAKAAPAVIDEGSFNEFFAAVAQEAGRSYLTNDEMPDPSILDSMLSELKGRALTSAQARTARLKEVLDGAACVQRGQSGLPQEIYEQMVYRVADTLEVGAIVEADFVPDARAGRSLTAEERSLSRLCQAEARNQPYDRRATYQKCLGRRKSAQTYPATSFPNPEAAVMSGGAGCLSLLNEVQLARRSSSLPESADFDRKLADVRNRFMAGIAASTAMDRLGGYLASGRAEGMPVTASQSLGLDRLRRPASFGGVSAEDHRRATDLNMSAPPPLDAVDVTRSVQLARTVKNNEIGFTGMCYSYVKASLQAVGIVSQSDIDGVGLNAHAKMFTQFVDKHPALLRRKLRKVANPHWPLPVGAIVVWNAGACGYSANSGHIEIVTRINPPQACSDGCGSFKFACLDELSGDAPRLAALVPAAERALAQAQADYDLKRTQANRRALSRARAELAKVQPQVTAYVVERETPAAYASARR